jgi:hypothetical protein
LCEGPYPIATFSTELSAMLREWLMTITSQISWPATMINFNPIAGSPQEPGPSPVMMLLFRTCLTPTEQGTTSLVLESRCMLCNYTFVRVQLTGWQEGATRTLKCVRTPRGSGVADGTPPQCPIAWTVVHARELNPPRARCGVKEPPTAQSQQQQQQQQAFTTSQQ